MTFPRDPNAPRPPDPDPEPAHPITFTVEFQERGVVREEDRASYATGTYLAVFVVTLFVLAFLLALLGL